MRFTRIERIFALLALATVASWWLGEGGAVNGQHLRRIETALVLALSAFKGTLIALDYMELRRAPALWRYTVMGWLVGVLGLIALFSLGLDG